MIDFIMSKIAMIVAAVFILLAGIGLWQIQKNAMEAEELQNIVDKITQEINELNTIEANTEINFTFDRYDYNGIYIKPTVGDDVYNLRFTKDILFITQNDRGKNSNFVTDIHVWYPEEGKYNDTELDNSDNSTRELIISSGEEVVIIAERIQIEVMGLMEYHTFIYTED